MGIREKNQGGQQEETFGRVSKTSRKSNDENIDKLIQAVGEMN